MGEHTDTPLELSKLTVDQEPVSTFKVLQYFLGPLPKLASQGLTLFGKLSEKVSSLNLEGLDKMLAEVPRAAGEMIPEYGSLAQIQEDLIRLADGSPDPIVLVEPKSNTIYLLVDPQAKGSRRMIVGKLRDSDSKDRSTEFRSALAEGKPFAFSIPREEFAQMEIIEEGAITRVGSRESSIVMKLLLEDGIRLESSFVWPQVEATTDLDWWNAGSALGDVALAAGAARVGKINGAKKGTLPDVPDARISPNPRDRTSTEERRDYRAQKPEPSGREPKPDSKFSKKARPKTSRTPRASSQLGYIRNPRTSIEERINSIYFQLGRGNSSRRYRAYADAKPFSSGIPWKRSLISLNQPTAPTPEPARPAPVVPPSAPAAPWVINQASGPKPTNQAAYFLIQTNQTNPAPVGMTYLNPQAKTSSRPEASSSKPGIPTLWRGNALTDSERLAQERLTQRQAEDAKSKEEERRRMIGWLESEIQRHKSNGNEDLARLLGFRLGQLREDSSSPDNTEPSLKGLKIVNSADSGSPASAPADGADGEAKTNKPVATLPRDYAFDGKFYIGRNPGENGIIVHDARARSYHAVVKIDTDGSYWIANNYPDRSTIVTRDNKSWRIEEDVCTALEPGDIISIYDTHFRFEIEGGKGHFETTTAPREMKSLIGAAKLPPQVKVETDLSGAWISLGEVVFGYPRALVVERDGAELRIRSWGQLLQDGDVIKDHLSKLEILVTIDETSIRFTSTEQSSPEIAPSPKYQALVARKTAVSVEEIAKNILALPREEALAALERAYASGNLADLVIAWEELHLDRAHQGNFSEARGRLAALEREFFHYYKDPSTVTMHEKLTLVADYLKQEGLVGEYMPEEFKVLLETAQTNSSLLDNLFGLYQVSRFLNSRKLNRYVESDVSFTNLILSGEGVCENLTILFAHFASLAHLDIAVRTYQSHVFLYYQAADLVVETTRSYAAASSAEPNLRVSGEECQARPAYFSFVGRINNLAASLLQGNRTRARELFEKAIELLPSTAGLYVILGKMYEGEQDFTKAVEYYQYALTINPRNKKAREKLGAIAEKISPAQAGAIKSFLDGISDPSLEGDIRRAKSIKLEALGSGAEGFDPFDTDDDLLDTDDIEEEDIVKGPEVRVLDELSKLIQRAKTDRSARITVLEHVRYHADQVKPAHILALAELAKTSVKAARALVDLAERRSDLREAIIVASRGLGFVRSIREAHHNFSRLIETAKTNRGVRASVRQHVMEHPEEITQRHVRELAALCHASAKAANALAYLVVARPDLRSLIIDQLISQETGFSLRSLTSILKAHPDYFTTGHIVRIFSELPKNKRCSQEHGDKVLTLQRWVALYLPEKLVELGGRLTDLVIGNYFHLGERALLPLRNPDMAVARLLPERAQDGLRRVGEWMEPLLRSLQERGRIRRAQPAPAPQAALRNPQPQREAASPRKGIRHEDGAPAGRFTMLAHEEGWVEDGGAGVVAPKADKKVASPTPNPNEGKGKDRFELIDID
ncbi:MAG: hypothetical protein HYU97_02875 [Deltaproteobacteria bacterium]|nr:hypothetical protein [Deltaproteobacteria bacterium]